MLPDALQHWSDYEVAGGLKGAVRVSTSAHSPPMDTRTHLLTLSLPCLGSATAPPVSRTCTTSVRRH